jgi:hypothetical protein
MGRCYPYADIVAVLGRMDIGLRRQLYSYIGDVDDGSFVRDVIHTLAKIKWHQDMR